MDVTTLEIIKFRDVLKVTEIGGFVPNLPRTIEIKGEDFSSAETISINDIPVEEFVIINKMTALVQLPESVDQVKTIDVISADFTRTAAASTMSFAIGDRSKALTGLLKLVQLFVKVLMTSQGSDIFDPDWGGNLQDIVGSLISTNRTDVVGGAVARSISSTSDQIRRAQLSLSNVPLEERLLTASLVKLSILRQTDEVRVRVLIDSVAGQRALTGIIL